MKNSQQNQAEITSQGAPSEIGSIIELPVSESLPSINGHEVHAASPVRHEDSLSVDAIREEIQNIHSEAETISAGRENGNAPAAEPTSSSRPYAAIEGTPDFKIRPATDKEIDDIVDVDMRSFESVYRAYGKSDGELREELHAKFLARL